MAAVQSRMDGGEAARQLSDAHRQLLNDNSIQFDLPTAETYPSAQQAPSSYNPPPAYPPPADPSAASPAPIDLPPPVGGGGGGVNGLMHVFLWIAAAIALAILLYWLVIFFRDRGLGGRDGKAKKERRGRNGEETWRPKEEQAVQLLDEAPAQPAPEAEEVVSGVLG